jgi:PTH1 family peptidyl-tRNA hydrolase
LRAKNLRPYIVAGLGNPGPEYADTRHNVGWMVIDHLVAKHRLTSENRREGSMAELRSDGFQAVLLKPAAYVNTSGKAVKSLAARIGVESDRVIIIHDDLDLDFAWLRIKVGGSSGGHRGINSVIASLGADDFTRIKVGIGRPPGRMDPAEFVLQPFTSAESPEIAVAIAEAGDAALAVVDEGLEAAMNRYNRRR